MHVLHLSILALKANPQFTILGFYKGNDPAVQPGCVTQWSPSRHYKHGLLPWLLIIKRNLVGLFLNQKYPRWFMLSALPTAHTTQSNFHTMFVNNKKMKATIKEQNLAYTVLYPFIYLIRFCVNIYCFLFLQRLLFCFLKIICLYAVFSFRSTIHLPLRSISTISVCRKQWKRDTCNFTNTQQSCWKHLKMRHNSWVNIFNGKQPCEKFIGLPIM